MMVIKMIMVLMMMMVDDYYDGNDDEDEDGKYSKLAKVFNDDDVDNDVEDIDNYDDDYVDK